MASPLRDPLSERAAAGAARLLRAQLRYADEAAKRLAEGRDPEALHDYRVGLRRLRALARAFARELRGRIGGGMRRRLRRLARRTGRGRDGEVTLAWLDARLGRLPAAAQPAATVWRAQLAVEVAREHAALRATLPARHARLAARLRRRLLRPPSRTPSLARAWRRHLAAALAEWRRAIAPARAGSAELTGLHAARIAGKNLRYLLDPLPLQPSPLRRALRALKRLQDLLGELHDRQIVLAALGGRPMQAPLRRQAAGESRALRRRLTRMARRLTA